MSVGRLNAPYGRAENAFFRYTSIIGDGLRAWSPSGQGSEAVLACHVLTRMRDLGRPASYAIRRWPIAESGSLRATSDSWPRRSDRCQVNAR